MKRCVIIGGGPAGLTAAYELQKLGVPAVVLEKDTVVGGLARTERYKNYLFDIGGHRFYTKSQEVKNTWHEILGDAFIERPRLSRIYYANRFFDYPIKPLNAVTRLGPVETIRIAFSYLWARLIPVPNERTFEEWVSNRFGRRLYQIFFKTYTEKVWGMPCSELSAEWAAQRIRNLDLLAVAKNAVFNSGSSNGEILTTLIDRFHYPRFGPGMMWERCVDLLARGGCETRTECEVIRIHHRDGLVRSVSVRDEQGVETQEDGTHFISSMPVKELVLALDPPPSREIIRAAECLRHRDFITVLLIVDRAEIFPDNWIYIHSSDVKIGRIQNFKNWSSEMVPDARKTSLGLEYFVQENDHLWSKSDAKLIELGTRECVRLGFCKSSEVLDGHVTRIRDAYPIYDFKGARKESLAKIRSFLQTLVNLQLVGRNGQHRYNNQDHSMITAMYAARNIVGHSYNVWDVNVDAVHHEEVQDSLLSA